MPNTKKQVYFPFLYVHSLVIHDDFFYEDQLNYVVVDYSIPDLYLVFLAATFYYLYQYHLLHV